MLHNTLRLLPWNHSLVSREFISSDLYSEGVGFYNNTSAWPVSLTESGSSNNFDRFDPTPTEYRSLETSSRDTTPYGAQFTRNKFSWYDFRIQSIGSKNCRTHLVFYRGTTQPRISALMLRFILFALLISEFYNNYKAIYNWYVFNRKTEGKNAISTGKRKKIIK